MQKRSGPRLEVREIILGSTEVRTDSWPRVYFRDDPQCTTVYTLLMEFVNNPVACTPESVAQGRMFILVIADLNDSVFAARPGLKHIR